MNIHAKGETDHVQPSGVGIRCPSCRHMGIAQTFNNISDLRWHIQERSENGNIQNHYHKVGVRRCPNLECRSIMFVYLIDNKLVKSYPPELIDFDTTNLPDNILSSLSEAVSCHSAGAYKACALMVRRLLEELCAERGAEGNNLKARLISLKGKVLIPEELLEAADELRILGNDAAHVEAKDYDFIGCDESSLAIDLAKELLKAVYQYSALVARLKSYKK